MDDDPYFGTFRAANTDRTLQGREGKDTVINWRTLCSNTPKGPLCVCVLALPIWTASIYQESFEEEQERLMRSNLQINIIGRCVVNTQLFINKSSSSHTATGVEESRRSRPPPNNYERLAGLADQPARLTTTTTNTTTDDDTEADQELDLIIPI